MSCGTVSLKPEFGAAEMHGHACYSLVMYRQARAVMLSNGTTSSPRPSVTKRVDWHLLIVPAGERFHRAWCHHNGTLQAGDPWWLP